MNELLKFGAVGLVGWLVWQALAKKQQPVIVPTVKPPTPVPKPVVIPTPRDTKTAAVQARLNAMGTQPPLMVDGVSGPKTITAIKNFQASHGIEVDGIVGPLTLAALGLGPAQVQPTTFEQIPLATPDFTPHSNDE